MSKKSKTVYNLEDETVVIKIDAKPRDCVCKHEEKQGILQKKNKQQVYQQHTTNQAYKLPFRSENQQVYPVSVTVEKMGKSRETKQQEILRIDQEPKYSAISNEYEQDSSHNTSSSISSKSTKSSSINERGRISEESRSFLDEEENIHATSVNNLNRTELDLSVSNIEIAHYPFKFSERSPSSPRSGKRSDRLPFKTDNRPVLMKAEITSDDLISSSNSESTISVLNIENVSIPLIQARDHGQHCAVEVSVLEKHKEGCSKKNDNIGRNIEDKVGSYDVVSRVVYRTCGSDKKKIQSQIKGSLKSYRINNPELFGKDLQEARSRVDTVPILPNYKCVLTAEFPKTERNVGEISGTKKISIESEPKIESEYDNIANLTTYKPPPEVLSVYIRTNRNQKVPDGFQKLHYRGDSCKLHDPEERTKQILQLKKVIEETSSEAYLSKSPRQFAVEPDAQVMSATAVADNPDPIHAVIAPQIMIHTDSEEDTDDSLVSLTEKEHSDTDSMDQLPPHIRREQEEMVVSKIGFFNCFRRNKQKRQREASIEFVRDLSGKRVTHSNDPPRRHNEENEGGSKQRKLSAQYKR